MIRTNLSLLASYKTVLRLTRKHLASNFLNKQNPDENSLLPDMGEVRRARRGSKVSRYFRYLVERLNIKRILGTNLALMVIASNFVPTASQPALIDASGTRSESNEVLTEAPIIIKTEKKVRYPVKKMNVSQGYGYFHPGIDIDGVTGDTVYPIMPGVVDFVGHSKAGYGNVVYVRHAGGLRSLYAHLSKIEAREGEEIDLYDPLGEIGATGRSFGDHLHLEIQKDGKTINPFTVLPPLN